jgi:RsiW-degrading membrane proteinase PrsW (M82 family)
MIFSVFYFSYLPTWIFGLVLRDVILQVPPPDTSCNNNTWNRPSIEMLLLTCFYVQAIIFHMYFALPVPKKRIVWHVLTYTFVTSMLAWSGQYSAIDMLVGVAVGFLAALFWGYLLFDFWMPRMPFFAVHSRFMTREVRRSLFYCEPSKSPLHSRAKWFIL